MQDSYFRHVALTPNDSPGEIHPMALAQLTPYQVAAANWPITKETIEGRQHNLCGVCNQNLWFTDDPHGSLYGYTMNEVIALTVAHIRQTHSGMIDGKETS